MMRTRRGVVLIALIGAGLLLASTALTWVSASGLGDTATVDELDVTGSEAATVVTAMGLVALAAAVALSIARKLGRWVIAVLLFIAGAAGIFSAGRAVATPEQAAQTAVGEATGTLSQAAQYSLGAGPFLAAAGSLILLIAAVAIVLRSGSWVDASASKKYRRAHGVTEGDPDEYDLWDGLSQGEDPTDRR